jgi:hypothetical protein
VRVPASLTYTVQITDRAIYLGAPMGPAEYNPPATGSAPFGFWRNPNAVWEFVNPNEPPFGAKVTAVPIPGDVNHDGNVNAADLLEAINAWGPCPPGPPCAADVSPPPNGDGLVNVGDLLTILNNWG